MSYLACAAATSCSIGSCGANAPPALNVRQQYTRDGDAGRRFLSLKTGDRAWRTIDLDDETATALRAHLDVQEFGRRSWGESYRANLDLVFCHADGTPYDPDTTTSQFERRAAECPGVIRIRFHDMRHTHATLLLEDGETERYVAERLGDTVEMVHETYGHVTPTMRVAAVRRLASRSATPTVGDGPVTDSDSNAVGEGPESQF